MAISVHLADAVVRVVFDSEALDQSIAGLKESFGGLENQARAALIPLAAITAAGAGLITTTVMTAARTEELGAVVDNLGRVAGYTEPQLRSTEESIKDLGITTQSAREIMSQLIGAHLDLADATNIARAAQDLAPIGMRDSSEAAKDLTYAIVSMNPVLLRKYSLYVNLNDVYEETAEALGKEVTALEESEKRMAYKNAVLEAAAAYTGTYEAAMTTAGKQIRSFSRFIEEASNVIGEYFLPYLTEAVEVATDLITTFNAADEATHRNTARVLAYVTAIAAVNTAVITLVLTLKSLIAALGWMLGPIGLISTAIGILTVKGLEFRQEFGEIQKGVLGASKSADEYADKMAALRREMGLVNMATGDYNEWVREQEEAQNKVADTAEYERVQFEKLRAELNKMRSAYSQATDSTLDHKEIHEQLINTLKEEATTIISLSAALREMGGSFYTQIRGIQDAAQAYRDLASEAIGSAADTRETTYRYNLQMARDEEDQLIKRGELLEKHAEKWEWVRSGHHKRTKKEIAEVKAYWAQKLDEEVADFDAAYGLKRDRKEEDYLHSIEVANRAAGEQAAIAAQRRKEELAALKQEQEERLLLLAFEMLEYRDILRIPIPGWEDIEVSAEEYFAAISSGLVTLTPQMKTELVEALQYIKDATDEATASGTAGFSYLSQILQGVFGDVMSIGDPALKQLQTATGDYVVKAGDTLSGLADAWGVTLEQILAVNEQIKDPDVIRAGQELKVPFLEAQQAVSDLQLRLEEMGISGREQLVWKLKYGLTDEVIPAANDAETAAGDLGTKFTETGDKSGQAMQDLADEITDLKGPITDVQTAIATLKGKWVENVGKMLEKLKELIEAVEDLVKELKKLPDLKTVTIRVKYETVGAPPTGLQYGFHGIVHGPFPFIAGEAGPEEVHVTPLTGRSPGTRLLPSPAGEMHFHFHEPIYGIEDFEETVKDLFDEAAREATGWIT